MGGGVTPDTCMALHRRCWTLDMIDRPDPRPEIESYYWDIKGDFETDPSINTLFLNSKEKPDLIIFDPPYLDKKAEGYPEKSISMLPGKEYQEFLEGLFALLKRHTKKQQDWPLLMQTGGIFRIHQQLTRPLKIPS